MRFPLWILLAALLLGGNTAIADSLSIEEAIDHPSRPEADRAFDAEFYPEAVMEFIGVKPGMRLAIIGSYGVYYQSIATLVLGDSGHLYMHNASWSVQSHPTVMKSWLERMQASPYANTTPLVTTLGEIRFPEPLDAILIDRFYHDVIRNAKEALPRMNRTIYDALKPGGHFYVLDAHARPSFGLADADALHRVEREVVIGQVESAGFILVDESEALRNPDDTRELSARRDIMTNTDRYLLKFEKPAP